MEFEEPYQTFLEYTDAKGGTHRLPYHLIDKTCAVFKKFLFEANLSTLVETIDAKVVRRYMIWMKKKNYAPATIKRKIDLFRRLAPDFG